MRQTQKISGFVHSQAYVKAIACLVLACGSTLPTIAANETLSNPSVQSVQQNGITIKGVVVDEQGEPIIGASVVEKGNAKNGTVTDLDGNYVLQLKKSNAPVVVSYIGYKSVTIVKGGKVTLQADNKLLDELVVVGYGTQKKATLTGSVSSIGSDELSKMAATNITNALAGKTAGVIANTRTGEPGADDANILIRGKGTMGDTSPLIVVDGVADRSFGRLNPDDIESISVLKDASAAIYGARAANGVILVTTKRGKAGKVQVKYDGTVSFSQPTRIPEMLNAYEYATYTNEFDKNRGAALTYPETAIQKIKDGSDQISFPDTNWWDAVAKDWATNTQHSLSISGGTEKISFYTSAQYMQQDPIYKNSPQKYKQYQFTTNLDAQINKSIKLSMDILGRRETRDRGVRSTEEMFGYFLTTNPMSAPYYPNGLLRKGFDGVTNNAVLMISDIPGKSNTTNNTLNIKPKVHVDLDVVTKGLYAEGYAALDFNYNNGKTLYTPFDIYQYNSETQEYDNLRSSTGNISLDSWSSNSDRITLNARIGYTRTFGDHKVDAFVSYEQMKYKYNYLYGYRTNFMSSALLDLDFGGTKDTDKSNSGSSDEFARQNWFGRVNYNYKDKYLAEATLRYDGSMNFAKGHRWGLFPAVSAGWVMSEESWFKPLTKAVNFLKLKASYGVMGNDNISAYQYLSTYSYRVGGNANLYAFGTNPSLVQGIYSSTVANPLVTWEKAHSWNAGFSSQFLNGMFGLDFDWFKSARRDILITRNASVPTYSGLILPSENLGKVDNTGFEAVAFYKDHKGDFSWNVSANVTYAKNEVIYMDEAVKTVAWQRITGHSMEGYTLYHATGIYQTQEEVDNSVHLPGAKPGDLIYEDTNGDKQITWDDAVRTDKSATPRWMFGLTLGGSWKGLDFTAFFQGQADAQILVKPTMNMAKEFYDGRWREDASESERLNAKYPRAFMSVSQVDTRNALDSDWWLRDASFVRLKSMEIGYTFPKTLIQHIGLSNARIYVNGNNLFTIDSVKIFDPEMTAGIKGYPIQRSWTFGLNLAF